MLKPSHDRERHGTEIVWVPLRDGFVPEGGHAGAREQVIRLAPHSFTSIDDIEAGLDALADLLVRR